MLVWQLILIQVVTFGLLVFFLRHLLYRQVTRALSRLEKLYNENLRREEELKKAKEEAQKAVAAEMEKCREEARRLRVEAELEAEKIREEAQAAAKEEAGRIVAEALAAEERMKARISAEGEAKAIAFASEILQRLFSSRVAEGVHHQLIEGLLEEIKNLDGRKFSGEVETIEVKVPFPLTADQRSALTQLLSSKIGRLITLKESPGPEVIAGMVVHLDNLVLDGSLANKLNGIMAHVRESLAR